MAKKHIGAKIGATVGLGLAAAAGALFLYGKEGKKNRKIVKSWALKAKAEALEQLENLKSIDEKSYQRVIAGVTKKYKKAKNVSAKELDELAKELKGHWKHLRKGK